MKALVRWPTGKRLTNRLPKLSIITLSPPLNSGILGLRMWPYVPTPKFFTVSGDPESDLSDSWHEEIHFSLHRFLWEQKVAKKVKVCKLFSQLSSCTLFMGAKSCEKSLETFTFDNNRAIWSKSLQTFCVANVAEESCTAEKIPVRGSAKS